MKNLCDGLTLFRLFACIMLVVDGLVWGASGSRLAIILSILGHTTDILDGRIARATRKPKTTIGSNEIIFDMLLSIGAIGYLGMAKFIPDIMAIAWAGWLLFLIVCPTIPFNLFWFFEATASVATLPLLILLSEDWLMLAVFVIWGTSFLIWDWKRAMEHISAWKKIIFSKSKKASE